MRHYQTSDNRPEHRNPIQSQGGNSTRQQSGNTAYNGNNSQWQPQQNRNQYQYQNPGRNQNNYQSHHSHRQQTPNRSFDSEPGGNRDYAPPPPPYENIESETKNNSSSLFGKIASDPNGLIQSLFKFIPPGIYNRETKKILGFLTAEDLLLTALIIMLADSEDNDDTALLIALVYILMG